MKTRKKRRLGQTFRMSWAYPQSSRRKSKGSEAVTLLIGYENVPQGGVIGVGPDLVMASFCDWISVSNHQGLRGVATRDILLGEGQRGYAELVSTETAGLFSTFSCVTRLKKGD